MQLSSLESLKLTYEFTSYRKSLHSKDKEQLFSIKRVFYMEDSSRKLCTHLRQRGINYVLILFFNLYVKNLLLLVQFAIKKINNAFIS